jgi:hypothetical protein
MCTHLGFIADFYPPGGQISDTLLDRMASDAVAADGRASMSRS